MAAFFVNAQTIVHTNNPGGVGATVTSASGECLSWTGATPNASNYTIALSGLTGSITYAWSVKGGANITAGGTSATVTVTPKVDAQGRYNKARLILDYTGTVKKTVTDPCDGVGTILIDVTEQGQLFFDLYQRFTNSYPIVGEVCPQAGQSYPYTIRDLVSGNINDGIGIDTYTWGKSTIEPGFAVESYRSGDQSAVTLNFTANLTGTHNLSVITGKCNTAPAVLNFGKRLAPPVPAITGIPAGGCIPATTGTITVALTPTAGVTYEWVLSNPNFTFTGGTNKNTQGSIQVKIGKESGNIILNYTPNTGSGYCLGDNKTTAQVVIPVKRSLDGSVLIAGSNCIVAGSTNAYSLSPSVGDNVVWTLPGAGWSPDPANPTSTYVSLPTTTGAVAGTLKAATVSCPANQISLNVGLQPGTPGAITASRNCLPYGDRAELTLSIPAVTNATSYTWTLPTGWAIKTGTPSNTASVTVIPSGTAGGTATVKANSACASSATVSLALTVAPPTPGAITRNPNCLNKGTTGTVQFTIPAVTGATSYEWTVPAGFGTISGSATGATITVNYTGAAGLYTISAKAVNSCGKSATASTMTVGFSGVGTITINSSPILDSDGNVAGERLEVNELIAGTTYTWFKNGSSVATGRGIDLVTAGGTSNNYCVEVKSNTTGCLTKACTTSVYNDVFLRVGSKGLQSTQIFPNPAKDVINLTIPGKFAEGAVVLSNAAGVEVYRGAITNTESSIDVSSLSEGLYLVKLTVDGETIVRQVQIIK